MKKGKVRLSSEEVQRIDRLLREIVGAEKEMALILGRALKFKSAPDVVIPAISPRAVEMIYKIKKTKAYGGSSFFAFIGNTDNGEVGIYNELDGTCTPVED